MPFVRCGLFWKVLSPHPLRKEELLCQDVDRYRAATLVVLGLWSTAPSTVRSTRRFIRVRTEEALQHVVTIAGGRRPGSCTFRHTRFVYAALKQVVTPRLQSLII